MTDINHRRDARKHSRPKHRSSWCTVKSAEKLLGYTGLNGFTKRRFNRQTRAWFKAQLKVEG